MRWDCFLAWRCGICSQGLGGLPKPPLATSNQEDIKGGEKVGVGSRAPVTGAGLASLKFSGN